MIMLNDCTTPGLQVDSTIGKVSKAITSDVKKEINALTNSNKKDSAEQENTLCTLETDFDESLEADTKSTASKTDKTSNKKTSPYVSNIDIVKSLGKIKPGYLDKNGVIGPTEQGATGDCWLLAGVNALSYTKAGREIIKNALEYKDGMTTVSFPGIQSKIDVSDTELAAAKECGYYSSGDDDMIILELAMAKARDKIASGGIGINDAYSNLIDDTFSIKPSKHGKLSTESGRASELVYFLTGKFANITTDKEYMETLLDTFQYAYNEDFMLTASLGSYAEAYDVSGESVKLAGPHAYAVKYVDDETVTITNPWSSGEEIKLPRYMFTLTFDRIYSCDLSNTDKVKNVATCIHKEDPLLDSKHYTFDCSDLNMEYYGVNYANVEQNYYGDNFASYKYMDDEGSIGKIRICNKNEEDVMYFDKNETLRVHYEYIDGKLAKEERFDEDGNLTENNSYKFNNQILPILQQ